MQNYVDSLLVINNERIREIYGNLQLSESFAKADDVLAIAAKGIAEIITVHGYINVDFADVETVMRGSGVALMGSGKASGPERAKIAVEMALNSPLLNNCNIQGAKNILYNIQSGQSEITMDELGLIGDYIQNAAGNGADVIWGNGIDPTLTDEISITIIATGFTSSVIPELMNMTPPQVTKVPLPDAKPNEEKAEYVVLSLDEEEIESEADGYIEQDELVEADGGFTVRTIQRPLSNQGARPMQGANKYELTDRRIEEMEQRPAFERRRQNSESTMRENDQVSRFTISDESSLIIRPDNSYLHDNVD
jgi:cell division protein FtsZ